MRYILFRGKTVSTNSKFVYGNLIHVDDYCCILEREEDIHEMDTPYLDSEIGWIDDQATPVVPETVGQWTGLYDRNGKEIFEDDVVKTKYGRLCVVVWFSSRAHCGWDLKPVDTVDNIVHRKPPTEYDLWEDKNLEVVGNIHDNPEFAEAK